ncbi:MAG: 4Fe-4S binding protein [Candidatus Eiseniibacteriota bacterium]|nr:MAG: 4Fe-4S binding protein [Candidatus Eisenbacteria bacterium]
MNGNCASSKRVLVATLGVVVALTLMVTLLWAEAQGQRRPPGFFDILALPRVWVAALFCAVGLAFLVKSWVSSRVRLAFLLAMFFVFGVLSELPLGRFASGMGLHPSPLCTVTRPFQFLYGGWSVPVTFWAILSSIVLLSLVGNKLFCGWVCPIGALQELSHRIPLPGRLKAKLPFGPSNTIRALIFAVFIVTVFLTGLSVYDYFNPFEFLHWGFGLVATIALVAALATGVFVFRPFCYLICPVGLLTWILEHLSVVRVRVNKDLCTDCSVCVKQSPCPAVPSILEGRASRPDCHACGRCIEVCPENALSFRSSRRR